MLGELDELGASVAAAFQKRSERMFLASRWARLGMVTAGTAITAAIQCAALPTTYPWPALSLVGVIAAVIAFFGALFIGVSDEDASKELASAESAIRKARAAEVELRDSFEAFEPALLSLDRATQLYFALMSMRGALERLPVSSDQSDQHKIEKLFEVSDPSLQVAMGLDISQYYTICVYRAEQLEGQTILRCVGHRRALTCDISKARTWPAGVGAAGMAYARGRELIFPDMTAQNLATIRDRSPSSVDGDADPYVSIVAVPIFIGPNNTKWGVVVATSPNPNHFSFEPDPGVRTSEGARALAGMVALALTKPHIPAVASDIRPSPDSQGVEKITTENA